MSVKYHLIDQMGLILSGAIVEKIMKAIQQKARNE